MKNVFLLLILCTLSAIGNNAVANENEDSSVTLFRASGGAMADADIAVQLSRMIIERVYGKQELAAQEPLSVTDIGNHWRIQGSSTGRDYSASEQNVKKTIITVEILKYNCQVTKLSQDLLTVNH